MSEHVEATFVAALEQNRTLRGRLACQQHSPHVCLCRHHKPVSPFVPLHPSTTRASLRALHAARRRLTRKPSPRARPAPWRSRPPRGVPLNSLCPTTPASSWHTRRSCATTVGVHRALPALEPQAPGHVTALSDAALCPQAHAHTRHVPPAARCLQNAVARHPRRQRRCLAVAAHMALLVSPAARLCITVALGHTGKRDKVIKRAVEG
jgi:hypothetical protein